MFLENCMPIIFFLFLSCLVWEFTSEDRQIFWDILALGNCPPLTGLLFSHHPVFTDNDIILPKGKS